LTASRRRFRTFKGRSALATALLFFTLLVLPDETSYHQLLLPGDFACDEHKIRIPCQELSVVV
jgi:hypothetical protein